MHGSGGGLAALVLGAVVLAPLTEVWAGVLERGWQSGTRE
jgi:hypothetical protein